MVAMTKPGDGTPVGPNIRTMGYGAPSGVLGQYSPGYGQAPYAQPAGASQAVQGAVSGAAPAQSLDEAIKAAAPYGQGAINQAVANYHTTQAAATAAAGVTAAGQGQSWLSPDELRAKTNALGNLGSGFGQSGGGAGAAAGGTDAAGTPNQGGGLNLSGAGGNAAGGATAGSLNNTSTPLSSTVGYQSPGSLNSTNTVGYNGPGQQAANGQAGSLQMQQANPQSAVDQYKNTAGYQLMNDPNAYQQSPGYQYAMDQAMNQVQNGASARGMLESGAVLKSMQQTASGLAQQDYGNWWNRQNQLYGDYQNRLQGLAGGQTGSADAMTAGANGAQANLQTGSNLGSLFGNQGTSGMGGIINTAAAQAGNMINAGQQQASVNAANQATQLAGATLASNQQQKGLF